MDDQVLGSAPAPSPAPNTYMQLTGVGALLKSTGNFYQQHFGKLLPLIAVFLLGNLLPLAARVFEKDSLSFNIASIVLTILGVLVGLGASIGMMSYIAQDGGMEFGAAYRRGLGLIFPYIWAGFLVGLVTFGGFLLLIVPGIIMGVMLSLTAYSVVAENRRGLGALVQSWHYVKGSGFAVFGRMLAIGLIIFVIYLLAGMLLVGGNVFSGGYPTDSMNKEASILETIVFSFVLALVEPLSFIYLFSIFRELRGIKGELSPEEEKSNRTKLIWLIVVGVVAVILMIGLVIAGVSYLATHKPNAGTINGIFKTIY